MKHGACPSFILRAGFSFEVITEANLTVRLSFTDTNNQQLMDCACSIHPPSFLRPILLFQCFLPSIRRRLSWEHRCRGKSSGATLIPRESWIWLIDLFVLQIIQIRSENNNWRQFSILWYVTSLDKRLFCEKVGGLGGGCARAPAWKAREGRRRKVDSLEKAAITGVFCARGRRAP